MSKRVWLSLMACAVLLAPPLFGVEPVENKDAGALSDSAPAAPGALLTSPLGIPGEVPAREVWAAVVDRGDFTEIYENNRTEALRLAEALSVELCDAGRKDLAAAIAAAPTSLAEWHVQARCAELWQDAALAEQAEAALAALLEHAVERQRFNPVMNPIQVMGVYDIETFLHYTGNEVLWTHYQMSPNGRYLLMRVVVVDGETQQQRVWYFDYLDVISRMTISIDPLGSTLPFRVMQATEMMHAANESASLEMLLLSNPGTIVKQPLPPPSRYAEILAQQDSSALSLAIECIRSQVLRERYDCVEASIDVLIEFAEHDFADAHLALAAAHLRGLGVEADATAMAGFLAAAKRRLGPEVAVLELQRLVVESSPGIHPALHAEFEAGAERDARFAVWLAAHLLELREEASYPKAEKALKFAIAEGFVEAKSILARHYLSQDQAEAARPLLESAMAEGDVNAAETLFAEALRDDDHEAALRAALVAGPGETQVAHYFLFEHYKGFHRVADNRKAMAYGFSAMTSGRAGPRRDFLAWLVTEPAGIEHAPALASRLLTQWIESDDDDPEPRRLLGLAKLRVESLKDPEGAERLLREAGREGAVDAQRLYTQAQLRGSFGEYGRPRQAERWRRALLKDEDPDFMLAYGWILLLGTQTVEADPDAAFGTWRRAFELSRSPVVLNEWAWVRCTAQDAALYSAEEAEWFAKELQALIRPDDGGRLDTVAACQAAAGQFEQAVATQEAALKLMPEPQSPTYQAAQKRLEAYRKGERAQESFGPAESD